LECLIMRTIGACFATVLLAATALSPTPSSAFGLNPGPLHLLPFVGFHHRFVHNRRTALHRPSRTGANVYDKASLPIGAAAQGAEPASHYPAVALPAIFDEVFWPAHAPPWPFGYDAIFGSVFMKSPLDEAQACRQPNGGTKIVDRIAAEIRPRPAQAPLLQKLGQALGMASGYLAKACPKTIPAQPVARLDLMQSQLQLLTMAIDLVRPALQQFEESLDAKQKTLFAAIPAAIGAAAECGAAPTATDWSVDQIDQSVQPGDSQRQALSDLKQTFASIAGDLHAHCPDPLPATPLARLEAIEGRLDASWRAALSMKVALAEFESRLSDQQRSRLEAMNLAEAR
jgi:LTXXQ motif family protein